MFAKFLLLSKIQTLAHMILVKQTSDHHHCKWHAQKSFCSDFQLILSSFFLIKNKFVCMFLRTNMTVKLSALKILLNQLICLSLKN